jgi:hypothetical protein
MVRNVLALLIALSMPLWAVPADEVSEALARAEALYYEADFSKSIDLLSRIDGLLQRQSGRREEKVAVKLQLALAYIGLNDSVQAMSNFRDLYSLDPDHLVDPQQFSPKVVQLAERAKAEQNEVRCRALTSDAERELKAGNSRGVARLIGSNQQKCPSLSAIASNAGDLFFKEGLDSYRKAQLSDALKKFREALGVYPSHEMATQYLELTENKLQLDADRVFLAWRKEFDTGKFGAAAKNYRELLLVSNAETVKQVRGEYRRVLSDIVESWNRACASSDMAAMEVVRQRVTELLPEPSIGEDILANMKTCRINGCVPMNAQLALVRLKKRVDPSFPDMLRSQIRATSVTVRVKARIDEKGDVVTADPEGGNAILHDRIREAVQQWKFSPAIIQGEARCVDAEIPIVINFVNPSASLR